MNPRHWHRKKTEEAEPATSAHRPIDEIRRDIANSPAQVLPALQAELAAAVAAQQEEAAP